MTRAGAGAAALLLMAGAAAAQTCGDLHAAALGLAEGAGFTIQDAGRLTGEAPCRVQGAVLDKPGAGGVHVEIAALEWTATGIDPAGPIGAAADLDLRVIGLRWYPLTGMAHYDYMMDAQNRRNLTDAVIGLSWDPETAVLDLRELRLDLPGRNAVSARLRISGLHIGVMLMRGINGMPAALDLLDLTIRNEGFFDGFYLAPLTGALGEDVAARVAAFQAQAQAVIGSLPQAAFSDETRAALSALVAELPVPWGEMRVSVRPETPLVLMPFARALAADPGDAATMANALRGVSVDVTYAPWQGWPE